MKMQEIIKNCEFCGDEITVTNPKTKYCSDSCKTKSCNQRKENELKVAEEARLQAEIAKAKNEAAEDKKNKKAEKAAAAAETQRIKELELQDTKDKKAAELAEQQRIADEAIEQKQKEEKADEEKRKVDKDLKDKADEQRRAEEAQTNANKYIIMAYAAIGIFNYFDNCIENQQKKNNKPDSQINFDNSHTKGNTLVPKNNFSSGKVPFRGSLPSNGFKPNLSSYQTPNTETSSEYMQSPGLWPRPHNTSPPVKPPKGFISSW